MQRLLVIFVLVLSLLQSVSAQPTVSPESKTSGSKELTIIATWKLGQVDNPVIEQPDRKAYEQMQTSFKELVAQYEDPLLLDLGGFTTPQSVNETGYGSDNAVFFLENHFDAAIVTNQDYVYSFATQYGFKKRPEKMEKVFLSSLDFDYPSLAPLHASNVVEKKNAGRIGLAHVSSIDRISSIPDHVRTTLHVTPEETASKLTADQPELTFLFSELPVEQAMVNQFPNPQLYFNLTGTPLIQQTIGSVQVIEPPLPNEFLVLKGKEENGVWSWKQESSPWYEQDEYAKLNALELPVVGMSVPGENRVATVLGVDPNTISVEVFRNQQFPGITNRDPIYVYLMEIEGVKYRVYRTRNVPNVFWIPFDALVVMNPDHTVRQFASNTLTLPYLGFSTRLAEGIQSIYNIPMEEWVINPTFTSGIEIMADLHFQALRNTVLVDRQLYGSAQ